MRMIRSYWTATLRGRCYARGTSSVNEVLDAPAIRDHLVELLVMRAMHLTLKKETTRPPGMNILQQQATFDDFVQEFNHERPHEALAMKCPAYLYVPARRQYHGLPELEYPLHDREAVVTQVRLAHTGRVWV